MGNLVTEQLAKPIPEKLWHYTSLEAFHGIVSNNRMWATDVRYLNDRDELLHARSIADELIEAAPELDDEGYPIKEWLSLARRLAETKGLQIFVICFTELEDDLSQWRAYSHASSGVSAAFDLRSVRPDPVLNSLVAFAPCIYPPEAKAAMMEAALRHFIDEVRNFYKRVYELACQGNPANRQSRDKREVVKRFLDANPGEKRTLEQYLSAVVWTRIHYLHVAALSKNFSFHGEREWRLVLPKFEEPTEPAVNPPQFRAGKTTLIPYIAHP